MSRPIRRHAELLSPYDRPGQDDYFSRRYSPESDSDDGTPYPRRRPRGGSALTRAASVQDDAPRTTNRLAHRPKIEPRDSSYYNPRDKYYLSGDEDKELGWLGSAPAARASSSAGRSNISSQGRRPRPGDRPVSSARHYDRDSDLDDYRGGAAGRRRHPPAASTRPPRSTVGGRRDSGRYYPPSASRSARDGTSSKGGKRPSPGRRRSSSGASEHHVVDGELIGHAARAGMEAAAVTALKLRNDPSPWLGAKGTKVAAAALGAAVVDTFIDRKLPQKKGGMRHTMLRQGATMALGNLVLKPAVKGTKMSRK